MNISGIVVKTSPSQVDEVMEALGVSGLCEVYFHDNSGRIIVTVEGTDTNEEIRKMKEIMGVPGVISANLAYTYNEEEIAGALDQMKDAMQQVPEALQNKI
jgi:nitrate reductase NapD